MRMQKKYSIKHECVNKSCTLDLLLHSIFFCFKTQILLVVLIHCYGCCCLLFISALYFFYARPYVHTHIVTTTNTRIHTHAWRRRRRKKPHTLTHIRRDLDQHTLTDWLFDSCSMSFYMCARRHFSMHLV